jgi:transcriptional regulator with XRE-family HTH domain
MNTHITQRSVEAAEQLGLSQRECAKRMSLPRTWISKIENLQCTPTLSSFEHLAQALETSMATLLNGGERSRQQEVEELMRDEFISKLAQHLPRLTEPQRRAITVQIHNMTLRRTA